ncbi:MAG: DUF1614 domain-containing protein [Euryarchaeota archaeon]|nr:DUF1614 domain-containing protein [Euryarchaeota archaeon]
MFDLTQIGLYLFYIMLPVLALYIVYLIITKAFEDMGFSSIEAIIIVFVSYILGEGLLDAYVGFSFSNIRLFSHGYWVVGINLGGAVIPIILSVYLIIKNKIKLSMVFLGVIIVAIIAFFVTTPIPEKGIVSVFPYWLLPAIFASFASIFLSWENFRQAAPLAYISGAIGVLIGADFLHLPELLSHPIKEMTPAVIGGADVFDMIFITGLLAVIADGILVHHKKSKEKHS